mmetsp:Transcript_36088/g.83119  ORF Transcript_36088/g.83119 Transcript_36088/m.83119 type:complete len:386 (-) Transcript_36088:183-1340(-)
MSSPKATQAEDWVAACALPARPVEDWPPDYFALPGCRFSFLPLKYRAPVALPPMKRVKAASEPKLLPGRRKRATVGIGTAKEVPPQGVPGCYGDFCMAQFRYPNSLKDIESLDDAWTRQGRELCNKKVTLSNGVTLGTLLEPEELVACLDDSEEPIPPSRVQVRRKEDPLPGKVYFSLVMEARGHPELCRWLQSICWRFNTCDAIAVTAAAAKLKEDELQGGGDVSERMAVSFAGLRYRLKVVPVCKTCFSVYRIIHDVITMVRVRRKDLWAARELERQQRELEETRQQVKQDEIERMLTSQKNERRTRTPPVLEADSASLRTSAFLDQEAQDFLRLIPDSPSAGTPPAFRQVVFREEGTEESEARSTRRSIRKRRQALFESLGS